MRRVLRAVSAVTFVAVVAWGMSGCGKKGPPLPPLPRGPLEPSNVTARQTGDAIRVSFRVPRPRGEKRAQEPVLAELLRVAFPPGQGARDDPEVFRRRGEIVSFVRRDPLEPGERVTIVDPTVEVHPERFVGWTLRYGVRVEDRRGRPSSLVAAVDLVPAEPVSAPDVLEATVTAEGVRLTWSPVDDERVVGYGLYRASSGGEMPERPIHGAPLRDTRWLDDGVVFGQSYRYHVRAVLTPPPSPVESVDSPPAVITALDVFPPTAPTGLVAVQEGEAVRLFWQPSIERDVAVYRVYRAVDDGPFEPVDSDGVEDTSFIDVDVQVGRRYRYRVTGVDRASPPNEGPPSETVTITVGSEPAIGAPP